MSVENPNPPQMPGLERYRVPLDNFTDDDLRDIVIIYLAVHKDFLAGGLTEDIIDNYFNQAKAAMDMSRTGWRHKGPMTHPVELRFGSNLTLNTKLWIDMNGRRNLSFTSSVDVGPELAEAGKELEQSFQQEVASYLSYREDIVSQNR